MLGLMGLCLELMTSIFVLVTQPFSLMRLVCLFGVQTICFFTHTWLQLVKAIIYFHLDLCWKIVIWTVAFFSLPYRVLIAIHREQQMEMHLHEMQIELESLAWDKKELQERLHSAMRNCRIIESTLDELEEDYDQAIVKIELLEKELQDLKDEKLRLNETQGKDRYDFKAEDDPSHQNVDNEIHGFPMVTEYNVPLLKSGYSGSSVIIKDLMHGDKWKDGNKGTSQIHHLLKIGQSGSRPVCSIPAEIIPRRLLVDEILDQCRRAALSQSLFSAILSLLIGIIIWEAEDPCMPLVLGLFVVVGLSLRSVVQFFSAMNNKPATDAAALLSFNWFILGTLTYPTLPRVTHLLAPLALRVANQTSCWLGVSMSGKE